MQAVSLFAGVQACRKERVRQVLERLAGAKQEGFAEQCCVYAPPRGEGWMGERPDLYLRVSVDSGGRRKVVLLDAPETGVRRPATSRLRLESRVVSGDVEALLEALGYTRRFAYGVHGTRYVCGRAVLTLRGPMGPEGRGCLGGGCSVKECPEKACSGKTCSGGKVCPEGGCPVKVCPGDPVGGGAWLLEATVDVDDASDRELMEAAVGELSHLRKMLQGVCTLEPADDYGLR